MPKFLGSSKILLNLIKTVQQSCQFDTCFSAQNKHLKNYQSTATWSCRLYSHQFYLLLTSVLHLPVYSCDSSDREAGLEPACYISTPYCVLPSYKVHNFLNNITAVNVCFYNLIHKLQYTLYIILLCIIQAYNT